MTFPHHVTATLPSFSCVRHRPLFLVPFLHESLWSGPARRTRVHVQRSGLVRGQATVIGPMGPSWHAPMVGHASGTGFPATSSHSRTRRGRHREQGRGGTRDRRPIGPIPWHRTTDSAVRGMRRRLRRREPLCWRALRWTPTGGERPTRAACMRLAALHVAVATASRRRGVHASRRTRGAKRCHRYESRRRVRLRVRGLPRRWTCRTRCVRRHRRARSPTAGVWHTVWSALLRTSPRTSARSSARPRSSRAGARHPPGSALPLPCAHIPSRFRPPP